MYEKRHEGRFPRTGLAAYPKETRFFSKLSLQCAVRLLHRPGVGIVTCRNNGIVSSVNFFKMEALDNGVLHSIFLTHLFVGLDQFAERFLNSVQVILLNASLNTGLCL